MRIQHGEFEDGPVAEPLPFPPDPEVHVCPAERFDLTGLPASAGHVFDALDHMSRRIDDLARELNCLGYFGDDGDDGPRAA